MRRPPFLTPTFGRLRNSVARRSRKAYLVVEQVEDRIAPAALADLQITNTGSPTPSVLAGDNVTYTITVSNQGMAAANTVSVSDALDANTTLVAVTTPLPTGWSETDSVSTGSTGTLTFTDADPLSAGASATFTIAVHVASNVASSTTLINTATDSTQSTQPSPNLYSASATAVTTVNTLADLGVTNFSTPDPVDAGNTLTYTVTVTNYGPSDANAVSLSDALDANTTLVAVTTPLPTGWSETDSVSTGSTGTLTFTDADPLSAGASATFTIAVHVASNVASNTTLDNTATVATQSTQPSPNPYSGIATAMTTVNTLADLGVTNVSAPNPVDAGNTLTYTVTVTNYGPSDANTVSLSDALDANTTLVAVTTPLPTGWSETDSVSTGSTGTLTFTDADLLSAGASATFTIEVHVASNVASNTTLDDTATVATVTAEPDPDTFHPDTAIAETTVNALADIVPTFDQTKVHHAGSTIPITIQVTKQGHNIGSSSLLVTAVSVIGPNETALPPQSPGNSQPGNLFTFDPHTGTYQFNLKTSGYAPGKYTLNFTIGSDPALYSVNFLVG